MFDVIVIGTGPAGGMVARNLSKKGFSVLVIERKKEVGYPIQCGEAVSEVALKANGLKEKEWIKAKHKGIKITVPNGSFFFSFLKIFSIDRKRFDKYLIEEALANGCKLKLRTLATFLDFKNGIIKVKTNRGIFESRVVVAADGPESRFAEELKLFKKKLWVRAVEYKIKFRMEEQDFLQIFLNEKYKNGYAWLFPRGDEINVGVGGKGNLKLMLDEFCKSLGLKGEKKLISGILPQDYVLKKFCKSNVLIVGDAAGLTNPIFSGGIHPALFSGKLAAEVISKAFERDDLKILMEYDEKLRKSPFCHPILKKAGKILYSFTNREFNFVGKVFYGKNWKDVSYLEMLKKFISKPKFFLKIKDFWTVKRGVEMSEELL